MRNILTICLLCFCTMAASAQEVYTSSGRPANAKKKQQKPQGFDITRLVVGGTLGIGFGNYTTIAVAPVIGYRITDKFAAGVGFGYQYVKAKDYFEIMDLNGVINYYDYKSNMISASVWARYLILQQLFAHVEYEHNFMTFQDYRFAQNGSGAIEDYKVKYNVPSLLVGIGYRQPVGANASFYIMGIYDVLQKEYSPYRGTIFPRIGFTLGF